MGCRFCGVKSIQFFLDNEEIKLNGEDNVSNKSILVCYYIYILFMLRFNDVMQVIKKKKRFNDV